MQALLSPEIPIVIPPLLARKLGSEYKAGLLQQLHFWLQGTQAKVIDGGKWFWASVKRHWKAHFFTWSDRAIRTALKELAEDGYIVREKKAASTGYHAYWYSINYEKLQPVLNEIAQEAQSLSASRSHRCDRSGHIDAIASDRIIYITSLHNFSSQQEDPPLPPQGGEGANFKLKQIAEELAEESAPQVSSPRGENNKQPLGEGKLSGEDKFSGSALDADVPVIDAEIVSSTPQNQFWYNSPTLGDWQTLGSDPDWEAKLPKDLINQRPIYPWYSAFPKCSINLSVAHPEFDREFVGFCLKKAIAQSWRIVRNLSPDHAVRAIVRCIKHKNCTPEGRSDLMADWIEMQEEKTKANSLTVGEEIGVKTVSEVATEIKFQQQSRQYQAVLEELDRAKAPPSPKGSETEVQPQQPITMSQPSSEPNPKLSTEPTPPSVVPESLKISMGKLAEETRINSAISKVLGWNCNRLKQYSQEGCIQLLNALIDKHQVPIAKIQEILDRFPSLDLEICEGKVDVKF